MMDRNNRGGRKPRRKVCAFCVDKVENIDYKTIGKYSRKVLSERAKIIPRRVTGTCAYHQRALTIAIKRARRSAVERMFRTFSGSQLSWRPAVPDAE